MVDNPVDIFIQVALVPSLLDGVERLRKAVGVNSSVLVEGEGGCGKSTVIHTMAALQQDENKPHAVTLYLGEHTDAKVCVCVCTYVHTYVRTYVQACMCSFCVIISKHIFFSTDVGWYIPMYWCTRRV